MYFVVIDLNQLRTRIQNSTRVDFVNPQHWLEDRQFVRSAEGWLASADSMNLLSCSEIVYSERRMMAMPQCVRAQALVAF